MRLLPVLFAAVLVWAVASGLWNAANGPDGPAPRDFASYRLTRTITGPEAVEQMSKLHGKGVGVTDGYVAHYDGSSGGAVLYVGETTTEKDAAGLLEQMVVRIGPSNRYFTGLKPVTVEGTRAYSVRGGQESHYFWQVKNKVVWVGFDRDDPAGLAAVVRAVR